MPFNQDKFKALVHYVCWRCADPRNLGATKLNKVLWFSDALQYLKTGNPITGATYVKQQFGPVPRQILPALDQLEIEGALAIRDVEYYGRRKREFFALKEPNLATFSAEEISLADSLIEEICENHTAESISELTHDDIWNLAKIGEEIPYHAIISRNVGELTEDDMRWAAEQAAQLA